MANSTKGTKSKVVEETQKTCFIIMPISNHPDYEDGHFKRVYEHIIKPACESEGFKPIRADDVKATNYIALDIVKQIIECDMAICDLSSKNPNVLYEVGIRQAFNLPVTFIKDKRTSRVFDIQGFRDVEYDETLRIDTVDTAIIDLAETLTNTYNDKEGINSLISMLGIEPAKVSKKEISIDTELILNAIKGIKTYEAHTTSSSRYEKIPDGFSRINRPEFDELKSGERVFSRIRGMGTVVSNNKDKPYLSIRLDDSGVRIYNKDRAILFKEKS